MTILSDIKWKMTKWLWSGPEDMPLSDPEYAEWIKPQGIALRDRRSRLYRSGRGDKAAAPKHIDEFHHRGSYERREPRAHRTPKATMSFRGKGSKVERRSRKRDK